MHKFLLLLTVILPLSTLFASSPIDTSFTSYEDFSKMSKREIKHQFGKDLETRKIISDHFKSRHAGFVWIVPVIVFGGGGIYFAHLGARSTNGTGGVVGLVLSIALLLPALISLFLFLNNFLFRKKPTKRMLYDQLRNYFKTRHSNS